jgi:uncharacterized protein (TIGR02569 family)
VTDPPPPAVLAAFGVADEPVLLVGGQGRSWLAGGLVFKPVDDEATTVWAAELLERIREDGFRVARPARTTDGGWSTDGWAASRRVEGEHESRWTDVIGAGEALHRAIRDEPRPGFLAQRDDPWATGDRVAWDELPVAPFARSVDGLARLAQARRPLPQTDRQLIHGDLTENVLFADGLAPAVIDLSPYWRPTGFASAIVIADALVWHEAGPGILDAAPNVADRRQLLIRALIYRLVTHVVIRPGWPRDESDALSVAAVARAVDLALG